MDALRRTTLANTQFPRSMTHHISYSEAGDMPITYIPPCSALTRMVQPMRTTEGGGKTEAAGPTLFQPCGLLLKKVGSYPLVLQSRLP